VHVTIVQHGAVLIMFHLIVQPVITGQMLSRGGQRTLCILMLLRERTEYVPQLWNWKKSLIKPVMRQKTCNYIVVRFFRPRSSCMTHIMLFSERLPIYELCMTISGGRTKQHVIVGFGELAAVD